MLLMGSAAARNILISAVLSWQQPADALLTQPSNGFMMA